MADLPPRQTRGEEQRSRFGESNSAEVCAGCGDVGLHWIAGDWYCEGCASCEVCGSPYCDEEEHRV